MRWHLLKRGCLGYLGAELGHKEEDQPVSPVRLHRWTFVSVGRLRRRGERCWGRRYSSTDSHDHVGERVLREFDGERRPDQPVLSHSDRNGEL